MRFRSVARVLVAVVVGVVNGACGDRGGGGIEALEASALAHRQKGAYDLAIADYDRAIAMDSSRSKAYFERGFTQQLAKRYDRALTDFDRAIALRPDDASAINSRGITYQLMGQYERAVASYDSALTVQPDLAIALKNRGRAHFYLGNFSESARDLSAGLALDTANAFVAVWLHMVRQHLGAGDTTELARHVARTDRTRWPAPVAALYLGRITLEQFADTLTTGDAEARTRKRCGGAFYGGEYLLWNRRTEEAKARLTEAASVCPRDETEYMGAKAELERLNAPR